MRTWLAAAGLLAVAGSALAVPMLTRDDDETTPQNQDRTKIEKELRDLEAQRAKIDARMRELRRDERGRSRELRVYTPKAGETFTIPRFDFNFDGKFDGKGLTEEQQREIRRAMEQAHKAVEEAMKNLPRGQAFTFSDKDIVIPKLEGLKGLEGLKALEGLKDLEVLGDGQGKSIRVYVDKDGKSRRFEGPMTQEERDYIKRDMAKLRERIRTYVDGNAPRVYTVPRTRVEVAPPVIRSVPAVPAVPRIEVVPSTPRTRIYRDSDGSNAELRDEIRRLRDEVERLRDEVRRGKPISNDKDERTRRFLSPYGDA